VNTSRFRPGSGFGLGFGAFLVSFLPLSLLPMRQSMTQNGIARKEQCARFGNGARSMLFLVRGPRQVVMVQDRIENQPIGPDGFSPVDGVVAEQQYIALA
jgi:hypothetical protein